MGAAPGHDFPELRVLEGEGDVDCGCGDEGLDDSEVGGVLMESLDRWDGGERHDGESVLEEKMGNLSS